MTAVWRQDWEWEGDEQVERSHLMSAFFNGSTMIEVDGGVDGEVNGNEEGQGSTSVPVPVQPHTYDEAGAPEGGYGGGDRRSISVSARVDQYHGEDWITRAACKNQGKLFFSRHPRLVTAALEMCAECEVMEACRKDALDNGEVFHGVVGGMTPSARRRAINQWRRKP